MTRRWALVRRASAVCLLLLAISPLTSPYCTLDPATLAAETAAHDNGSLKAKPSSERASVPTTGFTALPVLACAAWRRPVPPTLTDRHQAEQRVLRI